MARQVSPQEAKATSTAAVNAISRAYRGRAALCPDTCITMARKVSTKEPFANRVIRKIRAEAPNTP